MAISLQSTSPNELFLRDALTEQGLSFEEQYPIYEGGKFSQPKYFVDFLITYGKKKIIVECDGYTYHTSDYDIDKNIERDKWIKNKTGIKIIHFTSHQLKNELSVVVAVIKNELCMEKVPKNKLKFRGRKKRTDYIINVDNNNLHKVTLYYDHIQFEDTVWVTYKFEDVTLGKFSDIRMRAFYNVPDKYGRELALMIAMLDLKRSTEILCYCQSEWLVSYLNQEKPFKAKFGILNKIDELLSNHNYLAKYINIKRDITYYKEPTPELMILTELHSKCKQIRYERLESFSKDAYEDFASFVSQHDIKLNDAN